MNDQVYINGVNLHALNCIVLEDDDNGFLCLPERKEPTSNDWYEYNGLDVDLSEVHFKEKLVTVKFALMAANLIEFEYNLSQLQKLITNGYINYIYSDYGIEYTLRYIDNTAFDYWGTEEIEGVKAGSVTIQFALDNSLQLFKDPTIKHPRRFGSVLSTETALLVTDTGLHIDIDDIDTSVFHQSYVELNGIDLGQFGVVVNESYRSILKMATAKKPLTRTFARMSGALAYPSTIPTFEVKELTIRCTMVAYSKAEFYWNYEALFNNLSQTGSLQIDTHLGVAKCYFSKMSNFKQFGNFSDRTMVNFDLHFIQINPGFTYHVLGSTSDTAVVTDGNEYILYQN